MKNNYIPEIVKEKLYLSLKYIYALFLLFFSFVSFIAFSTFKIDDNSFLTNTSYETQNFFGDFGSYYASFIFYTFGVFGYFVILFFFIYSLLVFLDKSPKYIFIRLFLFFLNLILIPQAFYHFEITFSFIDSIETWGVFSSKLYKFYNLEYISYLLSILGILIFLHSQNILNFLKLPRIQISQIFKNNIQEEIKNPRMKKYPLIQSLNVSYDEEQVDYNEEHLVSDSENKTKYLSPSLEILDSKNTLSKKNLDKENVKANSDLLERVFQDFNIEIQVINVNHGPVVTLFEILPAAGIKINTIINLADDISRSMGVGAVRISQIYGTQYLGVVVPNEERETVTIKELLTNDNFKNTSSKILFVSVKIYLVILKL